MTRILDITINGRNDIVALDTMVGKDIIVTSNSKGGTGMDIVII